MGYINGDRKTKGFKNKSDADLYAKQKFLERQNQGIKVFGIPEEIKLEAQRCIDRLKPHGVTLTQAVDYYMQNAIRYEDAPTIKEITDQIIREKGKSGRRNATIKELQYRYGDFCQKFGDRKLASITLDELTEYFESPAWGATSRDHFMTKVSMLYHYALKREWCGENLVKKLDRPSIEESEVVICKIEQAAKILEHSGKHGIMVWAVLGLFAGIRPEEMNRLDWSDVNLAAKSIRVPGRKAKTRTSRIVEIEDTLADWLVLCGKTSGPVIDVPNFNNRRKKLITEAGIEQWTQDSLRHSYATYHLAKYQNEAKTALLSGNSVDVLYRHYRLLVSKEEAERFWALRPFEVLKDKTGVDINRQ